jgi:hypothetical protein
MSSPTVCCVLLVNGRAEMVRRAIASFRAQTYDHKQLVIWDTTPGCGSAWSGEGFDDGYLIFTPDVNKAALEGSSIGKLRNAANRYGLDHYILGMPELIAHWDSDDWSHPRRLEEQVALLQYTGRQCVGYRELLFWDTRIDPDAYFEAPDGRKFPDDGPHDEAWLYRNDDPRWVAGASMLYTREAWEACPFDDAPHEDQRWWMRNAEKCTGFSSRETIMCVAKMPEGYLNRDGEPRMICQMHADGTEQISRKVMESGGGGVWLRAPQFDSYCERTMKL